VNDNGVTCKKTAAEVVELCLGFVGTCEQLYRSYISTSSFVKHVLMLRL
jgi:hypothetical protein